MGNFEYYYSIMKKFYVVEFLNLYRKFIKIRLIFEDIFLKYKEYIKWIKMIY